MRRRKPRPCPRCGRPVGDDHAVVVDGGRYHASCLDGKGSLTPRSRDRQDADPLDFPAEVADADGEPFVTSFTFRHLLDAETGEELEIRRIHFEAIRRQCEEMGLEAGTRLVVLDRTRRKVRVALAGGRELEIEPHLAQLVEVEPVAPPGSGRPPAH